MKSIIMLVICALAPTVAMAQHKGSISFTDQEQAAHVANIDVLLEDAADCLADDLEHHQQFYKKHGISPFYGDQSSFSKLSYKQKKDYVAQLGLSPALVDQMKPTSCIGLTVKCMARGFAKAKQDAIWAKLQSYTAVNDYDGTALQAALRELGWTVSYWNPKPANNKQWDATEKKNDPMNKLKFWGYHELRYNGVMKNNKYYFNFVDEKAALVNFGTSTPQHFKEVPFYVGTAHTGYHVFPGAFGQVIEGHSTRLITDAQTVESSAFNPLANGGGPRGQYYSGLIATPPGYY